MRRETRKLTELLKIFSIVSNNDVTAPSNRTLILQQILEVANVAVSQSRIKLWSITLQHCYPLTKSPNHFIA